MSPDDPRVLAVARALVALVDALRPPQSSAILDEYRVDRLPPRIGRVRFRRVCADMHRAGVAGVRRDGRSWVATAEAWRAWRSRSAPRPLAHDVDNLLAAAGLRATRVA
jgi:hypothetical protein